MLFPTHFRSLLCLLGLSVAAHSAGASDLRLWYQQPASAWVETLPIGNGRMGAMVFGGTATERIQFNEDTLWTGAPHSYHHVGAAKFLPEIRALLAAGKQKEAETLALREFMGEPLRQQSYQPCGDLEFAFPGHESATDYRRELDLDDAVATTHYRVGDTIFTREVFASHPASAIVVRLTANRPGQLTFALRLTSPHVGSTPRTTSLPGLALEGRVQDGAMRFAAQVHARVEGGATARVGDTLQVTAADRVTLVLTAATNFVNSRELSTDADLVARCTAQLQSLAATSPDALLAEHQADHRALFRRVTLDLGTSPAAALPTDRRLRAADKSFDPQLAALVFQFGRYLLIASSRPGDQPANLQGVWNQDLKPAWGSKYTVNINTEMNYWPAEVTALPECAEPLFAMIADLVPSGQLTAREHYGARGWVLHHNTDLWRGTAPINASNHGIWPMGGAWLCQSLWEHYQFSGDRVFLSRAYPLMRGAAEFFLDTLVPAPGGNGQLMSGPSNSPEQGGLVMAPAMDHQILRGLFDWTARAADELGTDAAFAAQLRATAAKLIPNKIGQHSQLQEWLLADLDDPQNTHRHVSHLWALHPGNEITPRTPDLFAAARRSLEFRGDDGTGWSLAWKINFWARLLDGDHAHRMLMRQLLFVDPATPQNSSHGGTYPNLFDAHPPFQIDGNFGATAAIAEMLLQSQNDELHLLPALPSAWKTGRVTGLRARGGYTVDLAWADGKLTEARIVSTLGRTTTVRYGGETRPLAVNAGQTYVWR
ncbi:MAG: glycoside hydrolase family 95 protein [Candidatus Didemnitutus sp.]|nr:glycoside hydrolase family 95 protein [Candidatus Didemnitutus sp.]